MSKLSDMIDHLRPDGVEYVRLGDCCSYVRGVTYNKNKEIRNSDGYRVLRANNITLQSNTLNFDDVKLISREVKIKKEQFLYKNDILICAVSGSKEHIGKVAFIYDDLDYCFGGFMAVVRADERVNSRFLFHILTGRGFKDYLEKTICSSTINNLNSIVMNNFTFPLPPLPIQQEIVRILDTFTQLQTELQLRKKQYNYYREHLLTFGEEVPRKRLGDVCEIKGRIGFRGYTRKDLVPESEGAISLSLSNIINSVLNFDKCTYISWFKYNESPEIMAEVGDIVFTKTASVGKTALIRELPKETTINPQLVLLKKISCDPAFLSYYLQDYKFQNEVKKITGIGSVPNVSQTALAELLIPLPPLSKQREIASILDKFSALTTSLTEGIPAEIELRRKQYNYYRELLLTFKPKTL